MNLAKATERIIWDVDDLARLAWDVLRHSGWEGHPSCPTPRKSADLHGPALLVANYAIRPGGYSGWSVARMGEGPGARWEDVGEYDDAAEALKDTLAMAHEDWLERRIAAALEKGGGDD